MRCYLIKWVQGGVDSPPPCIQKVGLKIFLFCKGSLTKTSYLEANIQDQTPKETRTEIPVRFIHSHRSVAGDVYFVIFHVFYDECNSCITYYYMFKPNAHIFVILNYSIWSTDFSRRINIGHDEVILILSDSNRSTKIA